jgi:hypothetical protein
MAQDRTSASDFNMPSAAIDFAKTPFMMSPNRMVDVLGLVVADL